MKKKEALIVFGLAVLVTGISWFREKITREYGGFPLEFYRRVSAGGGVRGGLHYSLGKLQLNYINLLFNFLFWFLVIFAIWQVIKWVKGRV